MTVTIPIARKVMVSFRGTITRDAVRNLTFFSLESDDSETASDPKKAGTVAVDHADFAETFDSGDETSHIFTFLFGDPVSEHGCLVLGETVHLWFVFGKPERR